MPELGSGPVDLMLVPGSVPHVEIAWAEPLLARFLTGLSDRVPAAGFLDLEQRADDVLAVMAAAGSRSGVLYG